MNTQKDEVKKENAELHPSQNPEENLSNGIEEEIADPDDVPGGWNSNFQKRPDLTESDAQVLEQTTKENPQK